jgi:hypothetical protein
MSFANIDPLGRIVVSNTADNLVGVLLFFRVDWDPVRQGGR